MTDNVKKELEKNIVSINHNLNCANKLYSEEIVKMHFARIRSMVDYCEELVLKGEEAIE